MNISCTRCPSIARTHARRRHCTFSDALVYNERPNVQQLHQFVNVLHHVQKTIRERGKGNSYKNCHRIRV